MTVIEFDCLPIDLADLRKGGVEPRCVTFSCGEVRFGSILCEFVSSNRALKLSYELSNEAGFVQNRVSREISLRFARLTFGKRPFFVCPVCNRSARVLYLLVANLTDPPRCRICVGGRYVSDVFRRHAWSRRRTAMKKIARAEELLAKPKLQASGRARALDLLREGEELLRKHLDKVNKRASGVAGELEGDLEEIRVREARARKSA